MACRSFGTTYRSHPQGSRIKKNPWGWDRKVVPERLLEITTTCCAIITQKSAVLISKFPPHPLSKKWSTNNYKWKRFRSRICMNRRKSTSTPKEQTRLCVCMRKRTSKCTCPLTYEYDVCVPESFRTIHGLSYYFSFAHLILCKTV